MKIRELLRQEIWSKASSQKIFVAFGILIFVVVLGGYSVIGISEHWLTPCERTAARMALAELDSPRQSGSLSNKDFSARTKLAEGSVDEASGAARTRRDRKIVADLMAYQLDIVVTRVLTERHGLFEHRNIGIVDGEQKLSGMMKLSGMNENSDRLKLHKELD